MLTPNPRAVRMIQIAAIQLTTNARVAIDPAVVAEYAWATRSGKPFPPILVYADAEVYWLVDGLHRLHASLRNEHTEILAEVRAGTMDEALWESCAVNKANGLRRSNADKRMAVERALLHPRGTRLSDRQLALHCGVHHHTVGRVRSDLQATGEIRQSSLRLIQRGETTYDLDVSAVARANALRARGDATAETMAEDPAAVQPKYEGILDRLGHMIAELTSLASRSRDLEGLADQQPVRRALRRLLEDVNRLRRALDRAGSRHPSAPPEREAQP